MHESLSLSDYPIITYTHYDLYNICSHCIGHNRSFCYASIITGQKLRFPTCPAYLHMTFPTHIWQRIGQTFKQTSEMCRKSCPILQISYIIIQNSSVSRVKIWGNNAVNSVHSAFLAFCEHNNNSLWLVRFEHINVSSQHKAIVKCKFPNKLLQIYLLNTINWENNMYKTLSIIIISLA